MFKTLYALAVFLLLVTWTAPSHADDGPRIDKLTLYGA